MKPFKESLRDGFKHIKVISDPIQLRRLRDEGVLIDDEGYWSFTFGEHKEYELAVEPILEGEDEKPVYQISLYKNRVKITESLIVKS